MQCGFLIKITKPDKIYAMNTSGDFELRKRMFDEIKQFNRTEQEELYRILKKNGEEVSENRNGIFFDLMILKEETIQKVQEWVEFCRKNNSDLKSREDTLNQLTRQNPGITE
jgi:hypothetical protein